MRHCFFLLPLLFLSHVAVAAPQNVLFISIDTLRADRLGCYGYERPTSPHVDALAKEGMLFEDAVCEVPLTAPSMGSMLSSRYPRMNGATRNGLRLPAELTTVPEVFQESGYYTFCVQSNWTLKSKLSGIDQGFDTYQDGFREKRWGFMLPERRGEDVTATALKLLQERDETKPFFGWVHYSDPHAPYKNQREHYVWDEKLRELTREEKTKAKYDSEVRFTDAEVGKLLAALPANTAVVFVSDHGESLYEHGYLGHGRRIYQDNMHIPLIVRGSGIAPTRSKLPARGIDVGPTLLGLAGLKKTEGMLGYDLLHDEVPSPRPRVIETYGGAVPKIPGVKAIMKDAAPMRQGVLLDDWKLILAGRIPELYNLADDPGELRDLSKVNTDRVDELSAIIKTWDEGTEKGEETGEALDKDDLKALEDLGYL